MFCTKCGAKNIDDAKFCCECGSELKVKNPNSNVSNSQNPQNTQYSNLEQKSVVDNLSDKVDELTKKIDAKFTNQQKVKIDENNLEQSMLNLNVFTLSSNIDTSNVKRNKYNHPFEQLGGFLAFIYYGGLVSIILSCFATLLFLISNIIKIPRYPQFALVAILGLALMIVSLLLAFRFLVKIKNKDIDFLHFYFKSAIFCGIFLNLGFQIISHLITIITTVNTMSSSYLSSYLGPLIAGIIGGAVVGTASLILGMWLVALYFVKSVRVRTYMGTDVYAKLSVFTRNMVVANPVTENNNYNRNYYANNQSQQNSNSNTSSNYSQNNINGSSLKICPSCGAQQQSKSNFCTKCGSRIV